MKQKLILLASRLHLNKTEQDELYSVITETEDWDKTVQWAILRQAGPFLYQKLLSFPEKSLLPAEALEALRQSYLKTMSRNMVLAEHFKQVAAVFRKENIPVIAMKGIYLSEWLYKDLGLRQCSDVDLLVQAADGERALSAMRSIGFVSASSSLPDDIRTKLMPVHYPAMIKNGVSVEIHFRVHSPNPDYEINMEALWREAIKLNLHGVEAMVFRPEHLLITLIQHLDKHFSSSKFQFTGLYDISNWLDLYGDGMDVDYLLSTAQHWRLRELVLDYCTLLHHYFKVKVPVDLLKTQMPQRLEKILLRSMTHKEMKSTSGLTNYKSIRLFDTPAKKISYVLRMTFPRPAYMMQRYHFKNKLLLLYYYPYRFLSYIVTGAKIVGKF
jgi:hypothetical protein